MLIKSIHNALTMPQMLNNGHQLYIFCQNVNSGHDDLLYSTWVELYSAGLLLFQLVEGCCRWKATDYVFKGYNFT